MRSFTHLLILIKPATIAQIVLSIVQVLTVLELALLKSTTKQNLTFFNHLYLCKRLLIIL